MMDDSELVRRYGCEGDDEALVPYLKSEVALKALPEVFKAMTTVVEI